MGARLKPPLLRALMTGGAALFLLLLGIRPGAAAPSRQQGDGEPRAWFEAGNLTVRNASGDLRIVCQGGLVKVNGADPLPGPLPCSQLHSLSVEGGPHTDRLMLNAVTRADFPELEKVTIDASAGDDQIWASEFPDTIYTGAGDDTLVGVQPDDTVEPGPGRLFTIEPPTPSGGAVAHFQAAGQMSGDPAPPLAPGLGTTIEAANFDTNATHTGYYFIPPDPIAAAGPNHVVNVVNVTLEWYTKGGTQQNSQSLDSFFSGFPPALSNTFTFDPKVIYDQYNERFVVIALEQTDTGQGYAFNSSYIYVAVSDDSNPNGTWHKQYINSMLNIGGIDYWADYPGLAVDKDAIYITANMFPFSGIPLLYAERLWIIDKGDGTGGLYDGGSIAYTLHDPYATAGSATTTQPAHMFGTPPTSVGTFLTSYSGLTDGLNEYVQVVRVDDPLGTPTFAQQYVNLGNIDNASSGMPEAPQAGTTTDIETNDRRALNALWRDNALWAAFQVVPPSGTDAGQATAHWVQLDTSTLSPLSVADQGSVGGEDIASGAYTFFPSVHVDACGNMGIGFSASAAGIYAGAYYTGRTPSDAPGSVQPSGTLAAGTDYYIRTFGSGRNRWGDYSGIALDPADDLTFWVYNEYALTRGTPISGEDGRWGTRYGSFIFPGQALDFGDLPATYAQTLRADDGARHCLPPGGGIYLGSTVDGESDGTESSGADGDGADEDGVALASTPWQNGAGGAAVQVTVGGSGSGCLNAWVDWNEDGDFLDTDEHAINNASVSAGTTPTFSMDVPAGTFGGPARTFYARFRLFPTCPLDPPNAFTGTAPEGEVEDYRWVFSPTAVTLARFSVRPGSSPAKAAFALALLATALLLGGGLWSRHLKKRSDGA